MKGETKMEKFTKEELLEKLGYQDLSSETLEKVIGGEEIDEAKIDKACMEKCMKSFKDLYKCMKECTVD